MAENTMSSKDRKRAEEFRQKLIDRQQPSVSPTKDEASIIRQSIDRINKLAPEELLELKQAEEDAAMDKNMLRAIDRHTSAEGGQSLLNSREGYGPGGLVISLLTKALGKSVKAGKAPSRKQVKKAVDEVKKENPNLQEEIADDKQEIKDLRYAENYGVGGGGKRDVDSMITSLLRGDTESIAMTSVPLKATKTYKKGQMKGAIAGAVASFGGMEAYNALTKKEKSEFEKAFSAAHNAGEEFFMFKGSEYTTDVRKGKAEGGPSMLVPPEMEETEEEEMPLDTYTPDEQAMAEQVPDEEMEDDHLDFVLGETLDESEQEYLMNALESDPKLNDIFDKVITSASEFSGAGEVEGPGTGVSDSIPARLSDGEFVVTEEATDEIGADNLQKMMDDAERESERNGGKVRYAGGGLLDDPTDPYGDGRGDPLAEDDDEEIHRSMLGANQMPSLVGSRR